MAGAETPERRGAGKTQLTTRELASLNLACLPLSEAFRSMCEGPSGVYLVGSCEQGDRDYRDVDVRLIVADDDFDAMFARPLLWHIFSWAVAEWLTAQTGLPIDFQVQRMTEANEKFAGQVRNPVGVRARLYAGGGDATGGGPLGAN